MQRLFVGPDSLLLTVMIYYHVVDSTVVLTSCNFTVKLLCHIFVQLFNLVDCLVWKERVRANCPYIEYLLVCDSVLYARVTVSTSSLDRFHYLSVTLH